MADGQSRWEAFGDTINDIQYLQLAILNLYEPKAGVQEYSIPKSQGNIGHLNYTQPHGHKDKAEVFVPQIRDYNCDIGTVVTWLHKRTDVDGTPLDWLFEPPVPDPPHPQVPCRWPFSAGDGGLCSRRPIFSATTTPLLLAFHRQNIVQFRTCTCL